MRSELFVGIDIGGTKIAGGVVNRAGKIIARKKISSVGRSGRQVIRDIIGLVKKLRRDVPGSAKGFSGIGIAVPGLVDSVKGKVIVTPNMDLSGVDFLKQLRKKIKAPVKIGNDVNLGVLGEQWLGAARRARHVVGLFPGTGLGGGIIVDGRLLTGRQGAAGEIGHMVINPDGPRCSCGNKGCLEAYVGRWAIQRDIRLLVKKGKKTVISRLTDGDLSVIKSKVLAKALKKKDKVATTVMKRMAKMLGLGCISLRHIFDPEIIVLGGGIIEACADFIIPVVKKTVSQDPFFASLKKCKIVESLLKDDAVIIGAAALCLRSDTLSKPLPCP